MPLSRCRDAAAPAAAAAACGCVCGTVCALSARVRPGGDRGAGVG